MDKHQAFLMAVSAAVAASATTFIITDMVATKSNNKKLMQMGKIVNGLSDMNVYLADLLDKNNIQLSEFDKIAYSSFADIED